jgi:hypothetical protein
MPSSSAGYHRLAPESHRVIPSLDRTGGLSPPHLDSHRFQHKHRIRNLIARRRQT